MTENKCMLCGAAIPENRHICLTCEGTDDLAVFRQRRRPRWTNGDRIRSMHDGELAAFLVRVAGIAAGGFHSEADVRLWLGQEAKPLDGGEQNATD